MTNPILQFLASKAVEAASKTFDKEFEYSNGGPFSNEGGNMQLVAELSEDKLVEVDVFDFQTNEGVFSATFLIENNGQPIFEQRLSTQLN